MPRTAATARRNKYGARPTIVNGIRFHSKLEAARYRELLAREKAGAISNLERQVPYPVYWPGHEGDKKWLLFTYVCDFRYIDAETGEEVVEDVKGNTTGSPMGVFRVKQKGVRFAFDVEVGVVTRKRLKWFFNKEPEPRRYAE